MDEGDESSTGPVDPCSNGTKDEGESDIDCGGTCAPCAPGGQCSANEDCETNICAGGFCQTPTCYDGLQNGNEEGPDCGGTCPNSCSQSGCNTDAQCDDGMFCHMGECLLSSCENDIADTQETDVDCGGSGCQPCADGLGCEDGEDCISQVCGADDTCAVPACDDNRKNGEETDFDCGGSCDPCTTGSECIDNADCIEGVCAFGLCVSASCGDGVMNGSETALDCGGNCGPCDDGQPCSASDDCQSGVCGDDDTCAAPSCSDGVENSDETDVDCGGECGATCETDESCSLSTDCAEGVCEFGQCSAPDCKDTVQNGNETDLDCGGTCGATCEPGEGCSSNLDCAEGLCGDDNLCAAASCEDGVENGDETDLDCGGACGATCEPEEGCDSADDCVEGVCVLGVCQAASCTDEVANGTEEGLDCAGGCPRPCPDGDAVTCNSTLPDFQLQPAVASAPDGSFTVVVWASVGVNAPAQDGSGSGIYGRVFDAAGAPVGTEFKVNTYTDSDQQFPAVEAGNDGFVVVWQSSGQDGDDSGVYAQRYDDTGTAAGSEFKVNSTIIGAQRRPDVAMTPTGAFIVCWESKASTYDIYCQRYAANGSTNGSEFRANNTTSGDQQLVAVDQASDGSFALAWQASGGLDGSGVGIFMRRFDATATASFVDQQVNVFSSGDQSGPAIGMNASGEFVVAWSSDDEDGSNTGVYARRYSTAGAPLAVPFRANTETDGAQNNPAVALNTDGDFVIMWQTADDGALTGIAAQRYDQAGAAVSTEFIVNTTVAGLQENPEAVIIEPDTLVGVWSSGDSSFTNRDVVMQRYAGELP